MSRRDPWAVDPDRTTRRESSSLAPRTLADHCRACLTTHDVGACAVADVAHELTSRGLPAPRWPWPPAMLAGAIEVLDAMRADRATMLATLSPTTLLNDVPVHVLAHHLAAFSR